MGWRVVLKVYGLALFILLPFFLVELWPRAFERSFLAGVMLLLVPSTAVIVCNWFQSATPEVRAFIGQRIATKTNVALVLSALVIPVAAERLVRDYRHTQIQSNLVERVLAMTSGENLASTTGAVRAGVMAQMVDENERVFGLSFRGAIDRLNVIEKKLAERERQDTLAKEVALKAEIKSLSDEKDRNEKELARAQQEKIDIESQRKTAEAMSVRDKAKLAKLRDAETAAQKRVAEQAAALSATSGKLKQNEVILEVTETARTKAEEEAAARKDELDTLLKASGDAAQQYAVALQERDARIKNLEESTRDEKARLVAALLTSADYLTEIADKYSAGEKANSTIPATDISYSASTHAALMYEALTPNAQVDAKLSRAKAVAEQTKSISQPL